MEPIVVATASGRVTVTAERTEWQPDGTLELYADGQVIAEFPTAEWAVHKDNLDE